MALRKQWLLGSQENLGTSCPRGAPSQPGFRTSTSCSEKCRGPGGGCLGSGLQPRAVMRHIRGVGRHWRAEGLCPPGQRTVRLRTGSRWPPRHRQLAGKAPPAQQRPPGPHEGPAQAALRAEATAPSSRSARRGPRSRGGRTRRSPRRAPLGRPRRAAASGRAASGRGPRPSWSCCSECACGRTAGSGSGSGCRGHSQSAAGAPGRDRGLGQRWPKSQPTAWSLGDGKANGLSKL